MSEGGSLDQAQIITPLANTIPVTLQEPGTVTLKNFMSGKSTAYFDPILINLRPRVVCQVWDSSMGLPPGSIQCEGCAVLASYPKFDPWPYTHVHVRREGGGLKFWHVMMRAVGDVMT